MNIIITGASKGIGYETAKLLSTENKVIAIARNEKNLLQLKGNSKNIFPITFDFESGNICDDLFPQIQKHFQSVDILINNAATFVKKPFDKITRKEFEKIFQINVFAIAELTQALLPLMSSPLKGEIREGASHVLNIASMGGVQGSVKFPGLSAYSSSKAAVIALTECLAEEYKNKSVSFNCISFGAVQTEMLETAFPNYKAPITAKEAAEFVAHFAVNGQKYFDGKILQMALSTP